MPIKDKTTQIHSRNVLDEADQRQNNPDTQW
jgi:hypothetical protein